MHKMFGTAEGKCKECFHYCTGRYHSVNLRKCEVYGLTHSEASDWVGKWQACGLFNQETAHQNVIELVKSRHPLTRSDALWDKSLESPLPGQVSFEEVLGD